MGRKQGTRNMDIRQAIKEAGLFVYEVADYFKVSESTFLRWLHSTLTDEKRNEIIACIQAHTKKEGE